MSRGKNSTEEYEYLKRKAWRERNHDKIIEQQKERRRKMKRWAVEYKGDRCARCSQQFHDVCYEFHHLDPSEKDSEPSQMFSRRRELLTAELDKCVLLCSNCHRLTHWEYEKTRK